MVKILKNDKGFTLIEVIISITTLAIISGFILRMFVVSAEVNQKAQDVDIATAKVISVIELLKAQPNIKLYLDNNLFDNCNRSIDGETTVIYQYFDKEWNVIDASAGNSVPDMTRFVLSISLSAENSGDDVKTYLSFGRTEQVLPAAGELYSATVLVQNILAEEGKQEIVALSTKKYFTLRE